MNKFTVFLLDLRKALQADKFAEERKSNMKELIKDIFRQLFGLTKPREGKIVLTRKATQTMLENGLYPELIQDVLRYGVEVRQEVIVKKYSQYTVGIYYKYDGVENIYRITFVFKN